MQPVKEFKSFDEIQDYLKTKNAYRVSDSDQDAIVQFIEQSKEFDTGLIPLLWKYWLPKVIAKPGIMILLLKNAKSSLSNLIEHYGAQNILNSGLIDITINNKGIIYHLINSCKQSSKGPFYNPINLNALLQKAPKNEVMRFVADIRNDFNDENPSVALFAIEEMGLASLGRIFFLAKESPTIKEVLVALLTNNPTFRTLVIEKAVANKGFRCLLKEVFADNQGVGVALLAEGFHIEDAQQVNVNKGHQAKTTMEIIVRGIKCYHDSQALYENKFLNKGPVEEQLLKYLQDNEADAISQLTEEEILSPNPDHNLMYLAIKCNFPKISQFLIEKQPMYCSPAAAKVWVKFAVELGNLKVTKQLLEGYEKFIQSGGTLENLLLELLDGNVSMIHSDADYVNARNLRDFLMSSEKIRHGWLTGAVSGFNDGPEWMMLFKSEIYFSIHTKKQCFTFLNSPDNKITKTAWLGKLEQEDFKLLFMWEIAQDAISDKDLGILVAKFFEGSNLATEYKATLEEVKASKKGNLATEPEATLEKIKTDPTKAIEKAGTGQYPYRLLILAIGSSLVVGCGTGGLAFIYLPETCQLLFSIANVTVPGGAIITGAAALLLTLAISKATHMALAA